ncbi:MAG: hypothetical protein SFV81_04945 [Pirellulaceae bacterium]|nr:hypothetical protein [Pirellulaceae bacterium]
MQRFNSSLTAVLAGVFLFAANLSAHAGVLLYGTSFYFNSAFAVNSDGSITPFSTPIASPSGIAVDATGNVYVASQVSNSVLKFNAAGTLLGTFTKENISIPVSMAFNSSGQLFVANNLSGAITRYSAQGDYLGTFATGLNSPMGLTIDKSGNVYVSDFIGGVGPGKITKFSSSGTILDTIDGNLLWPGQLVVDGLGNIYATSAGSNNINKYNSSGDYVGVFANGRGPNNYGLAYDSTSGTFYQATFGPGSNGFGAIQRFDANGNSLGYLAINQQNAYFLATIPTASIAAVPEPSAFAWAGVLALLGLTLRRRKS